jgi:leucyl aminopeptidase
MRILIVLALFSNFAMANGEYTYITIGNDAAPMALHSSDKFQFVNQTNGVSLLKVKKSELPHLSHFMHEKFKRCGGFMRHDTLSEAQHQLKKINLAANRVGFNFFPYSLDMENTVIPMINSAKEDHIRNTIVKLSNFHNRYYKAQTGVDSQKFIHGVWSNLTRGRSDAKVSYFKHEKWPQPSVMLTIKGSERPNEVVVIGGHADSIAGYFGGAGKRAPGADDNASGMATITEVIRAMVVNNYKPKRTVAFFGYAAEEVGLLGSKEIATWHRNEKVNVVGVLQLDMTNFNGSKRRNIDISMMTDYTNEAQNKFLGEIIDKYVKVPWGYSKCGYGCSDHASWHTNGYKASMPFESHKNDMNRNIHTAEDLISKSGGNAFHALKFSKMAIAYMVEMAK